MAAVAPRRVMRTRRMSRVERVRSRESRAESWEVELVVGLLGDAGRGRWRRVESDIIEL